MKDSIVDEVRQIRLKFEQEVVKSVLIIRTTCWLFRNNMKIAWFYLQPIIPQEKLENVHRG